MPDPEGLARMVLMARAGVTDGALHKAATERCPHWAQG